MKIEYRVMSLAEHWNEEGEGGTYDDGRECLIRYVDGEKEDSIASEGEPEDASFARDMSGMVDELNKLANILGEQRKALELCIDYIGDRSAGSGKAWDAAHEAMELRP